MSKKEFWIKFAVWTIFTLVLPISYLIGVTDFFHMVVKTNIWLLIMIGLIIIFLKKIFIYIQKGMPFSLFTQIVNGFVKVILPMLVVLSLIVIFRQKANEFIIFSLQIEQFLYVLIFCELVGIVVNPFPKWVDANKDENFKRKMGLFFDKIKNKNKDKE